MGGLHELVVRSWSLSLGGAWPSSMLWLRAMRSDMTKIRMATHVVEDLEERSIALPEGGLEAILAARQCLRTVRRARGSLNLATTKAVSAGSSMVLFPRLTCHTE